MSGGLHEKHVVATLNLGKYLSILFRYRETKAHSETKRHKENKGHKEAKRHRETKS
jgi:hypothetical protein